MGCGQSNEDSNNKPCESDSHTDDKASRGTKGTRGECGPGSVASPHNNSITAQGGDSMAASGGLPSVASSHASAPGVTMPTHAITDSTGHKVISCIGSRNKLEVVTRWLDSVLRNKEHLVDSRWRNPQEEAGREKQPHTTASQASGGAGSLQGYAGSPSASTSQLFPPGKDGLNQSCMSNVPFGSPQNADMLGPASGALGSPIDTANGKPNGHGGGAGAKYEIDPGKEQKEVTTPTDDTAKTTNGAVTEEGGKSLGQEKSTDTHTKPPQSPQVTEIDAAIHV